MHQLNVQRISFITRVQLSSHGTTPVFSFTHGVWTCIGQSCGPSRPQGWRKFQHPHRTVICPSQSLPMLNIRDRSVTRLVRAAGGTSAIFRDHRGHTNVRRLMTAELRPNITLSETTARDAIRYGGLSVKELEHMLCWLREAVVLRGEWRWSKATLRYLGVLGT